MLGTPCAIGLTRLFLLKLNKSARAKAAALSVMSIMPTIGPRKTHDYHDLNLRVPGLTQPNIIKCRPSRHRDPGAPGWRVPGGKSAGNLSSINRNPSGLHTP